MSNPNPPRAREPAAGTGVAESTVGTGSRSTPGSRWLLGLALAALAAFASFIGSETQVVAGGSDSSGYLNSARLLAAGRLQEELRLPPEFARAPDIDRLQFVPQGFNIFEGQTLLSPTYPSGLPLHFAAAARVLGWQFGPFLVQLVAAVAAVWLCHATARLLRIDRALAVAGAAVLAVFPVFLFTSVQTLSDTLATTWTLAALYAALRGRTSAGWRVATGAAFAMAVLVRPTNVLLAPGLVALIGFDVRRLAAFVLGGVPGAAWLLFYNHRLYGGALQSGYGAIFDTFALEFAAPTALQFAKWLALFLPTVVLALPLAIVFSREHRTREAGALALIVTGIIGAYLLYSVSHEVWWCLRFILPAIPALILLALLGAEAIARGRTQIRMLVALLLVAWAAASSWYWTRRLNVLDVPRFELAYARGARLAAARVPPGSLVLCSHFTGSIYYYTTLPILLFEETDQRQMQRYLEIARDAQRPVYAVIFDLERERLHACCPGAWRRVDGVDNVGIWRLQ